MTVSIEKISTAKVAGQYKNTSLDTLKSACDFRLVQVGPAVIRWNNGNTETVSSVKLKTLQSKYTWKADF